MRNKIIHKIFTISLLFLTAHSCVVYGQRWKMRRYDVGIGAGTAQVFGDIGGTASESNWFGVKDVQLTETRLALTTSIRYKIDPTFSLNWSLSYAKGGGRDEGSRNERGRSYNVRLYEFSGRFEYFFLKEDKQYRSAAMYNRRGMVNNFSTFAGYAFLGLGVTYSVSEHGDAIVYPFDEYRSGANVIPVIPYGLGVRYIFDEKTFLNGEFGYRWALTDYVDGYKQTEASKHTDLYYFFILSLHHRLKTTRRNIPAFLDRRYSRFGR